MFCFTRVHYRVEAVGIPTLRVWSIQLVELLLKDMYESEDDADLLQMGCFQVRLTLHVV